jgi:hypothetical protein
MSGTSRNTSTPDRVTRKRGRPRLDAARGKPLAQRYTDAERGEIAAAASQAGMSISAWIRAIALEKARL